MGEHDLLDAECAALIGVLRERRRAGQALHAEARALAQRVALLQDEHQAHLAAQLAELRSLQERSAARLQSLQQRVNRDGVALQACGAQFDALRAVHARMAQELLAGLHVQAVHVELKRMQQECGNAWQRPLRLHRAFAALSERLHLRLSQAQRRCEDIHGVMTAGYAAINAAHGLTLTAEAPPALQPFIDELTVLSGAYARQMGPSHLLRLIRPGFQTRLVRQLQVRLVRLFHGATAELEGWSHALWTPAQARLDQSRDRLQHRHDAVQRVQQAADELQQRIVELEAQELLEQERFGHALRLLTRLEAVESGDRPKLQVRAA
ncbi:hypothetical protein [Azohydromonas caseinilytica]|uniref:Uncharacterized protein n=1 Tax=Azohydromonas caseinilytica TaxID=2728836 RepID=A0A848F122_9BURK|nr:hypothetical protein [Azohydromonas caseinilytica]NML13394.1 hypothetical protein [Azohydromonas caseinilytica]